MVVCNISASSVLSSLHLTLLVSAILRWLLQFWKICGPLAYYSTYIVGSMFLTNEVNKRYNINKSYIFTYCKETDMDILNVSLGRFPTHCSANIFYCICMDDMSFSICERLIDQHNGLIMYTQYEDKTDTQNILIIKPTRCTNFSNLFLE